MRKMLSVSAGSVAALALCYQATAVNVSVPGTSNPWLAGMPGGTSAGAGWGATDFAPAQSPVLAQICVQGGATITWTARGTVGHPPTYSDQVGPDGSPSTLASHSPAAENGIADVRAPINSLLGVFLDASQPNLTPAPGMLDFSALGIGLDYTSLAPGLKQVFFMGDGVNSTSAAQSIVAPTGATRLYLGTMDGYEWNNNTGTITVEIQSSCNGVPDAGSMLPMLGLAMTGLLGFSRRFRS